MSDWLEMAQEINQLEHQGTTMSQAWFLSGDPRGTDLEALTSIHQRSLERLSNLSTQLDQSLKDSDATSSRQDLQHAYNLTEELIQSRQADLELLHSMTDNANNRHPEFGRALAIKERAAAKQTDELMAVLSRIQ